MISRNKFSIITDQDINKYNYFYDDFIIDFTVHHKHENGKLDFEFLSLMNKVYCNIMKSNYFIKAKGDRYDLVNYEDKYLTTRDKIDGLNYNYNISTDSILDCPENLKDEIYELINNINNIISDEDYPSFMHRNKAKHKYKEVVPTTLNEMEKIEFNKFLKNFPEYNIFFSKKTIKETLTGNNSNSLEIELKKSFSDHFEDIRSIFPYSFYEGFKDINDEFYKIKNFIKYDIELDYLFDEEDIVDNDIWFSFKINNQYKGGAFIHSDKYSTVLGNLSILKNDLNDINSTKIFKFITSQENVKNDLIFNDRRCFSSEISNKDIRAINKNKRIYFSDNERELFLDISFFIENNNLDNKKEEVLNDFYKSVILEKQHLINSENFIHNKESFNSNIKNKYSIEIESHRIFDRESFLNNLVAIHTPELLHLQLKKELKELNFSFNETDDKLKRSSATKDLIDFIKKLNININEEARHLIFSNIDSIGNFIYVNDSDLDDNKEKTIFKINYNSLYDFLIDNEILPKGDLVKIYRLEDSKGNGIYSSDKAVIKKNKMLEYSDNKLPSQERELCQIFNFEKINSHNETYQDKFYFGCSDINKLKKWVKNDILELVNSNFKLFEYEINENYLLKTSRQVAFIKEKSTSKKEMNINELLNINFIKNKIKNAP